MPRRKKRWWKPKIDSKNLQSIFALVFILTGILSILTLFAAIFGVENTLQDYSYSVFGYSIIFLPITLILVGLSLTELKHKVAQPRLAWGMILLIVSLSMFFGIYSKIAGGWIGTTIDKVLIAIVTKVGVGLISVTFIIISLIIVLNKSFFEIFAFTKDSHKPLINIYQWMSSRFAKKAESTNPNDAEERVGSPANEYLPAENLENSSTDEQIEILDEPKTALGKPLTNSNLQMDSRMQPIELPYEPPPISLLEEPKEITTDENNIQKSANIIERTLQNFGIQAHIIETNVGPAVTQFAIDLAEGTKTNKITNLQNELALALASPTGSVRIEVPIPGKRLIGIEVPNITLSVVTLKSILEAPVMKKNPSKLAVALGQDVSGQPLIADVAKWPHLLVAGQTGSGKSVLLHALINSILFRAKPKEVSFIMIDPKRVELSHYNNIPHLQTPVIVDPDKTVNAFKWTVEEMEKRYRLFQQISARNLEDFNQKTDTEKLPYVIIVVDELADLMSYAANEVETLITRIAQKARATGILMILATQRPSVSVITGLIKANIPSRIALNVTSGVDSRVIIDMVGAEKLLGRGDMLYLPSDKGRPIRVQGVFMSDNEIVKITNHLRQFQSPYMIKTESYSTTEAIDRPTITSPSLNGADLAPSTSPEPEDSKFVEAVKVILNHDKASASLLQRRLKVGYARAARLLDELEEKGLVAEKDGSHPRDVHTEAALNFLSGLNQDPNPTDTMF